MLSTDNVSYKIIALYNKGNIAGSGLDVMKGVKKQ